MVNETDYWYDNRQLLKHGQVFRTEHQGIVKLDRPVPGDGTDWYFANHDQGGNRWDHYDDTIHPGDLIERLPKMET